MKRYLKFVSKLGNKFDDGSECIIKKIHKYLPFNFVGLVMLGSMVTTLLSSALGINLLEELTAYITVGSFMVFLLEWATLPAALDSMYDEVYKLQHKESN